MSNIDLKKLIVPAVAAALVISGVLMIVFADKYRFRAEPKLEKKELGLEVKSTESRKEIHSTLCRDSLPEKLKDAYDTAGKFINESEAESFWLENISKDEFKTAFEAYTADHPEVFWIDTKSSYKYYEMDTSLEIEFCFSMSGDTLETAKKKLDEAVKKAFTSAPEKADDLDAEVFINDYLVNHCKYNEKAEFSHTSYGALVNGEAVCDGYSLAFKLLCDKMGIECSTVEGTADFNDGKDIGHMWNCVKIGGDWYNVDVTWNDISTAKFYAERYFYLNLTDKEIKKDHKFSPLFNSDKFTGDTTFNIFLPECKTDKLKYLDIYCVTISDLSKDDEIIASLIASAKEEQKSCSFVIDSKLDYKETCDKIINDGYINEWIDGANHYCDRSHKIAANTKAYIYGNQNVLTVELNYG